MLAMVKVIKVFILFNYQDEPSEVEAGDQMQILRSGLMPVTTAAQNRILVLMIIRYIHNVMLHNHSPVKFQSNFTHSFIKFLDS